MDNTTVLGDPAVDYDALVTAYGDVRQEAQNAYYDAPRISEEDYQKAHAAKEAAFTAARDALREAVKGNALAAWVTNVALDDRDYSTQAMDVLRRLPATFAALDDFADERGWCSDWTWSVERAVAAGALPKEATERPPAANPTLGSPDVDYKSIVVEHSEAMGHTVVEFPSTACAMARSADDCANCANRRAREAEISQALKEALAADPLCAWLLENVQSIHQRELLRVIEQLPATLDTIKAFAKDKGWCGTFEDYLEAANDAGVIPSVEHSSVEQPQPVQVG